MSIAILADLQLALFPWITIVAAVLFIPLSTVIVVRAALSEMDQLIQELIPPESEVNANARAELQQSE